MSGLRVVDFVDTFLDHTVYFKVILMDDSFYVWIGTDNKLSNMAVAMPAKSGSTPSSSSLFGGKKESNSSLLAQKLAKRFSKQVFISCSIPFEQNLSLLVEKRLSQELGTLL